MLIDIGSLVDGASDLKLKLFSLMPWNVLDDGGYSKIYFEEYRGSERGAPLSRRVLRLHRG